METNTLPIILAILGSSVITALITTLGRRRTDQAVINNTLLENARKYIAQIRTENGELRARIEELDRAGLYNPRSAVEDTGECGVRPDRARVLTAGLQS